MGTFHSKRAWQCKIVFVCAECTQMRGLQCVLQCVLCCALLCLSAGYTHRYVCCSGRYSVCCGFCADVRTETHWMLTLQHTVTHSNRQQHACTGCTRRYTPSLCACVHACVRACVHACVRVLCVGIPVCVSMCACVCVRERAYCGACESANPTT